ncbi:MAG: addiction module protein [Gemmatimonadetes bacterium]|nr:addiction module protein [Gemmatimonadota bacterium]
MDTITVSDLLQLSLAERIQLVEDLWATVAAEAALRPERLPMSEEQRSELLRVPRRTGAIRTRRLWTMPWMRSSVLWVTAYAWPLVIRPEGLPSWLRRRPTADHTAESASFIKRMNWADSRARSSGCIQPACAEWANRPVMVTDGRAPGGSSVCSRSVSV